MTIRDARVFITGGAGFIGSSIASRLVADNDVVLFDHDVAGGAIRFTDLADHPRLTTIQGDICDEEAVAKAVIGSDVVIHTAAVVGVGNVISRPRETMEVNLMGTVNVLKALEELPGLSRFVFFSTSEVFGGSSFRVDEAEQASIGSVDEARWSYSISKLAGEHLAFAYHRELELPVVIVRPFNIFGPRRTGDHAMLRFVGAAIAGDDLVVHGDGSQVRSWCYIDDFVTGILSTLDHPEAVGNHFNLGNPRNTLTIYELAKRVIQVSGSSSKIRFEKIGYSDIDIRVPTTTKAYQLLGYEPQVEIEEGIDRTVAWYRDHPEVYEAISPRVDGGSA